MKIVITCGHPFSGLHIAHDVLVQAGLGNPELFQTDSISPAELHRKIFTTYGLDPEGLGVKTALNPENLWQEQAIDLCKGYGGKSDWGWVDARSVWLLNFWKELDPQTRFVMVYSAPEFAVGKILREGSSNTGNIEGILASWLSCNSEMLGFYNRNPDRCLLVNTATIIHKTKSFIDKVNEVLGFVLVLPSPQIQPDRRGASAIASSLAKPLLQNYEDVHALYRELESSADVADTDAFAMTAEHNLALAEYAESLAWIDWANKEMQESGELAGREKEEKEKIAEELHVKVQQLTQLQEANDALKHEHTEQKRRLEELDLHLQDALVKRANTQAELSQEVELLLLQLHQVQEDNEHYCRKWKELSATGRIVSTRNALNSRFWQRYQPYDIIIRFREELDGDNWYLPESDGRWAGPGSVSTIRLPSSLRKGRCKLYLEVIDAMARGIITDMEIYLNGSRLDFKVSRRKKYPVMVYSDFIVEDTSPHTVWEFQFKFPRLISPADRGSDDTRHLAIRVRSLRVRMVAYTSIVIN